MVSRPYGKYLPQENSVPNGCLASYETMTQLSHEWVVVSMAYVEEHAQKAVYADYRKAKQKLSTSI